MRKIGNLITIFSVLMLCASVAYADENKLCSDKSECKKGQDCRPFVYLSVCSPVSESRKIETTNVGLKQIRKDFKPDGIFTVDDVTYDLNNNKKYHVIHIDGKDYGICRNDKTGDFNNYHVINGKFLPSMTCCKI